MSPTTSGYVHVSRRVSKLSTSATVSPREQNSRSRQVLADPQMGIAPGRAAGPYGQPLSTPDATLTPPLAVVSESSSFVEESQADTSARGFVIYVGLDEQTAHASGTSLTRLAQLARAYVHQMAPNAQSHAAVALASTEALGTDLEVVRQALGDPTVVHRSPVSPVSRLAPERFVQRSDRLSAGGNGLLIDLSRREVFMDAAPVSLTYKEFELLSFLVENVNRTVGREELLDALWARGPEVPSERTIDVHIRRLRSKLGRMSSAVRTVRGEGYRFYEHPEVVVWSAPEYTI